MTDRNQHVAFRPITSVALGSSLKASTFKGVWHSGIVYTRLHSIWIIAECNANSGLVCKDEVRVALRECQDAAGKMRALPMAYEDRVVLLC